MTVLIAIIVVPLVVGYWYGRHNVDPNSVHGKIYYSTGEHNGKL